MKPTSLSRRDFLKFAGLAGLFIVTDDEEASLNLPAGSYEIPLVLQDRSFDKNNQFRYITGGSMTVMMTEMMAFLATWFWSMVKPITS